jgi:hypothetical protein
VGVDGIVCFSARGSVATSNGLDTEGFSMTKISMLMMAGAGAVIAATASADTTFNYATSGSTYTQNFDSLAASGAWSNNVTVPSLVGWNVYRGGTSANTTRDATQTGVTAWSANTGSSTTGAFYAFASTGSSDRAIGGLSSNTTGDYAITLAFKNTTGGTLTGFTLNWALEQWRDGGSATPAAQSVFVDYKISTLATSSSLGEGLNYLTDAAYVTGFTALTTATSPIFANTGGGAALDGNAAANRVAVTDSVSGLSWANDTILVVRFWDNNHTGNDHAFGIDDVTFTAVPAPGAAALLGLAGLRGSRRRR